MELTDIISTVSNVGFPIALCCYVVYLKQQDQIRHEQNVKEISAQHDAREADFARAMQQTAAALSELSALLKGGSNNA